MRPARFTVPALPLLLAATAMHAGDTPHQVLASAGGTVVAGDLKLSYTLGEPVAGVVSAGDVVLSGGFQALFVAPSADLFQDGFESSPPPPSSSPSGATR